MHRILLALVFLATPAFAQNASLPSPNERAIGAKLMAEINAGLTCSAALITAQDDVTRVQAQNKSVQDELVKAQARIKELEAKYEPKGEGQ
jgi:hypothetical protein